MHKNITKLLFFYNYIMDNINVLKDQSEILDYDNASLPIYLRKNQINLYANKRVLCAWHKDFEFIFIEKGHLSFYVNGQIVLLNEGDGIFVNSRMMHYGFSADLSDSTYLCLIFNPVLLTDNAFIQDMYVEPLENNVNLPYIVLKKEISKNLYNIVLEMYNYQKENKKNCELLIVGDLFKFWFNFIALRNSENEIKIGRSSESEIIKKMLSYIYLNYMDSITIQDVAEAASVSISYASHIFKRCMKTSIIDYANSYRITKSCDLLLDLSKDISDVSFDVGFTSSAYFSKLFKREKGITPKEYRNLIKQKNSI